MSKRNRGGGRRTHKPGERPPTRSNRRSTFQKVKMSVAGVAHLTPDDAGDMQVDLLGTAVNVRPEGVAITAAHVISDFISIYGENIAPYLLFPHVEEGELEIRPVRAGFARPIDGYDVAVIALDPQDHQNDLPWLPVHKTCEVWEGEELALCGFPYGIELHHGSTITSSFQRAMVSAVLPNSYVAPQDCTKLQLDAMVNPGNSGGPLFRMDTGEVLGVVIERHGVLYSLPQHDVGKDDAPQKSEPEGIHVPSGIGYAAPARVALPIIQQTVEMLAAV